VALDTAVIANTVLGLAPEVVAEGVYAFTELLEDNDLSLDLADLLCDDPFSHLLDDE
jgi:hypothetical protein